MYCKDPTNSGNLKIFIVIDCYGIINIATDLDMTKHK